MRGHDDGRMFYQNPKKLLKDLRAIELARSADQDSLGLTVVGKDDQGVTERLKN